MSPESQLYKKTVKERTQHKQDVLGKMKEEARCYVCGYNKCHKAMCFHHVDPNTKEMKVSGGADLNKRIYDEIKKCVILCFNCHIEYHAGVTEIEIDKKEI